MRPRKSQILFPLSSTAQFSAVIFPSTGALTASNLEHERWAAGGPRPPRRFAHVVPGTPFYLLSVSLP